ncbi:MAG: sugar ABC transporter ATP-binding protein [Lachnospiraceae bacterium]
MAQTVLEVKKVCKSFGNVHVLKEVDLEIHKGEIHALVGENGAGKSTIIKIISGVYKKDSGTILLDGKEVNFIDPKEAMDAGIRVIHQEINMVKTLTVAENIFLGNYPTTKWGSIGWKKLNEDARSVLEILGDYVDVQKIVARLSIAEQQMIEIAKALSVSPKILIMDEPTAALNDQETETLFQLLERLKKEGVAIIYITHRFSEIYRLADCATVMRDGETVTTLPAGQLNDDTLVSLMVGQNKNARYVKKSMEKGGEIFRIQDLVLKENGNKLNLTIHQGELVVVFGLVGAGQTELCRAIFGDLPYADGEMWLDGKQIVVKSIQDACREGIGYVSDDRKNEGLIPLLSVQENICLPSYPGKLSNSLGIIRDGKAKQLAQKYYEKLLVKSAGLEQKIGSLSGGNQQKGLICRWLANDVRLLILNMPTRGVDVGARAEIYRTMEELAEQGVAVLTISQEMPEVLAIADTIYVMHEGNITGRMEREEATQEKLMKYALGIG